MADISYPILRTEKTDIAGSVVVTPSGGSTGTAIVAADLTNGFTPVTVSFAAGETSKPVNFAVADDSAVEGTETYRLTMSNPQPSGVFPSGAFVEGTIADNDTGGGSKVVYGPTSASDTGYQNLTSTGGKLETVLNDTGWITDMICDADGQPGYRVKDAGINGRVSGFNVASDGTESQDGAFNYAETPSFSGVPMVVTQTAAGDFTVTINGTLIRSLTRTAGGTYIRHRTGGAAVTSTITKN